MSCFTGVSGEQTWLRAGNSDSRLRKGLSAFLGQMDGLGEGVEARMP